MKYFWPIVCFFCLAFVPADEDHTMLWDHVNKVSWEDFKGNPDHTTDAVAITASGLSYDLSANIYGNNKVEVDCKVFAYFYPYESWFKQDLADEYTLAHERLHFDITELMARKFRQRISTTQFTTNVKKEVKSIYQEMTASLDSLQKAYDSQTNCSINKEQQAVWQLKIAKELETTREYK